MSRTDWKGLYQNAAARLQEAETRIALMDKIISNQREELWMLRAWHRKTQPVRKVKSK